MWTPFHRPASTNCTPAILRFAVTVGRLSPVRNRIVAVLPGSRRGLTAETEFRHFDDLHSFSCLAFRRFCGPRDLRFPRAAIHPSTAGGRAPLRLRWIRPRPDSDGLRRSRGNAFRFARAVDGFGGYAGFDFGGLYRFILLRDRDVRRHRRRAAYCSCPADNARSGHFDTGIAARGVGRLAGGGSSDGCVRC